MGIFGEDKKSDNVQEEIRVLATNVEVLNHRLSTASIGDDPILKRNISQVIRQINYLYGVIEELEKNVDDRIDQGFKTVGGYFADVEKRIDVIGQLSNYLYRINEVELSRLKDSINALEKVIGENKELWDKLNDVKLNILKTEKSNEDRYASLRTEMTDLKDAKQLYSTKLNKLGNIIRETDGVIKKMKTIEEKEKSPG